MKNQTRTDLLNYLNNNKIKYTFDIVTQQIVVDLTVTEEDEEDELTN
jgi:riboflavin synthase